MKHMPHDSRHRTVWHRRLATRTAFVLTLAGVVLACGVLWQRQLAAYNFDHAIVDAPAQRTEGANTIGFSELAVRDEQIRVWNIARQADTGSALVLGQLAAYHMQRAREGGGWADYLEAESLARHSLAGRLHRNGASAVTLVNALLAQHRFTEAYDVAHDLVQREHDVPEYRALLGEVAMELGHDTMADSMFRSVWTERRHLSLAPRIARWLELTNHVREARVLLTYARDDAASRRNIASETKAWFHMRLGDLELRAGNVRRAEQSYRDGLAAEPGDPRLYAAMARLAVAKNNPQAAIAWGERALGLQLDPAALGLIGDAYARLGDRAKAKEYFQTLEVAVAGQPGPYHRMWSLYLLDHGLRVDSVLARAAGELTTRRDVYGYDLMAWALYKSGRVSDAHKMMQRALRFGTPDPQLQAHAAAIAAAVAAVAAAPPSAAVTASARGIPLPAASGSR